MMFCPVWSDIDVYYSSISSERESTAIELLRLDSSQLFSEDLPDETLRSALRSRLYLCRESWRDGQRRLRKRAAADISSGQREEAGELSEPAKGESSTSHLVQQSHSMPPLKIALKLPNSQREMVRLSAGQDVDCTGDTSYIDRLEASMNTLSWSSEYGQLDPWSLNPTRPPTSETELKEPDSNGNRSLIHPTDKLTVSSMGPPTSFSANPAEDSEISVVDRPSQRKSGSANIHDEDTITVDVEGRKGMMLAEHARKTSFMKRQRAFSSSQNAKVCYNKTI